MATIYRLYLYRMTFACSLGVCWSARFLETDEAVEAAALAVEGAEVGTGLFPGMK